MAEEERNQWGAIILDDRPPPGEEADLGRALDVGFGELTEDPVGAIQRAPELIQEGDLPGLEIMKEAVPVSEFPLEPGESRAAQELPEMFGTMQFGPEEQDIEAGARFDIPPDPLKPLSMLPSGLKPSGVGSTLSLADTLEISAAAMTMHDPAEIAQMLIQRDPETGERKWPEFQISQAPDGTLIVNNSETGRQAVINRPGMSTMDAMQMMGIGTLFLPAARATAAMTSAPARWLVGMGTAGSTEGIIQSLQEAAGGTYDKLDVALSSALGPIVETGRGLWAVGQGTGKFIGSYTPKFLAEKLEMIPQGIERVVPAVKSSALSFAAAAKNYLESGREAILVTQDMLSEATAPWRQLLLKMFERTPIIGTGGMRKAQQRERVEIFRKLGQRYDLDPSTNYGSHVINDLNTGGIADELVDLTRRRAEATAALHTMKDPATGEPIQVIIRDFRLKVRDLIAEEAKYGDMADKGFLDLLNTARNAVWQGGKKQDFGRSFGELDDWVQRLYHEAGESGTPRTREALREAADALQEDLVRTAKEQGGDVGSQWVAAGQRVKDLTEQASQRNLQGAIDRGEIDQQIIRKVLKGGDAKQLRTLYDNMGQQGRQSAQQMILRNAMKVGGWRRGPLEDLGTINLSPKKIAKWMETESVQRQLDTFFPGQKAEMKGMLDYLMFTEPVEELGKGIGMAAATGGMAFNLGSLGIFGFVGHVYQSKPIRNLLLRLHHIKGDVRARDEVMKQLTPLLMAGGRQTLQEWQSLEDQQDMILASTEFIDYHTDAEGNITNTRLNPNIGVHTGEPEPGLIDQLREAVGYEPGQGIGSIFGMGEEEAAPEE